MKTAGTVIEPDVIIVVVGGGKNGLLWNAVFVVNGRRVVHFLPPPEPFPTQAEGIWLPLPLRERAGVRV